MKTHTLAQLHLGLEPVGAQLGQTHCQARLQLASGIDRVERIADRAQQLHGAEGVGAAWINRVDAVFAGNYQPVGRRLVLGPAAGEGQTSCQAAGQQGCCQGLG